MTPALLIKKRHFNNIFFFLPVLPVVFFFLHNANRFLELMLTTDVLLLFLIYSLSSFFVFICSKFIFRLNILQSLFISTLVIIGFLFFGVVQNSLLHLKKFAFLGNSFFLLLLIVAILISFIIFFKRKKISPLTANIYFISTFLVLIFFELVIIGSKLISGKSITAIIHRMSSPVLDEVKPVSGDLPDIYHIILDEYTNSPALKKYWGYDNEIYPFFTSKGFFTLDSATSNYAFTPFSIASIFNLQYLKGANPYLTRNSPNFSLGQLVYRNNALFRFLKLSNYNFSIFSVVDDKKLSTGLGFLGLEKPGQWLREQTAEKILLNPWTLNKIKRIFGIADPEPNLIAKSKQYFADYNKKAMEHIYADCQNALQNNLNQPVFSFTHILLPHEPYMFDENGKLTNAELKTDDMEGYLAQLKYSNKLIEQITNCLLSDTTRKKIIIFQGDHGYRNFANSTIPPGAHYEALCAIYFYNKNYMGLQKKLSHVNTYRVILNNFFKSNLPLLKDSIVLKKD